ncbi:MAG TPA: TldD/PmbA family protein [Candidatus Latescibacteria bacterium]|nr:TldD/PmbA family protein [Candidatus Latescibacterota bacterium]
MESILKKVLSTVSADYVEVRLEEKSRTSVVYVGKELEDAGTKTVLGGNVRVYHKGGWGFASFNDLNELPRCARDAVNQARLIGGDAAGLARVPVVHEIVDEKVGLDPRDVSLEEKEELVRRYNQIILNSPKVQTSRVVYRDTIVKEVFGNSEGCYIEQEKVYTGISYSAIARDGINLQRAWGSKGDRRGYRVVTDLEHEIEKSVKDAVDLLSAPKVSPGQYTVILDPELSGVFVHEAFGHLSEADFLYDNPELLEKMKPGTRFGPDELSIVDDGSLPQENGYNRYDDEGVLSRRTYLIREGILSGHLHSRETAGRMGEEPTGNARALDYRFRPIVRMSCTYIEPREWKFEEMLSEVKDGIYAIGVLGGQTGLEMFTFTAMKAYLIKDGKLGPMVRDVVLSGNVFETLMNIDAIGDDLRLKGGLGGCGKQGQSPLPVSDGGPHIRVKKILIG